LAEINDDKFRVIVTKSTIPPTTTKEKIIPFVEEQGFAVGKDIGVANNPEFLREGHCWDDFINSDRIVLGCSDEKSEQILKKLYDKFDCPVFTVSLNTGEFIKYLSNTLLATMISFANEMSIIADNFGDIDVANAFRILHLDKRLKDSGIASYIYPGCGYGGYCLPKDTNAIYALSKSKGFTPEILENTIRTNDNMHKFIADKITRNISREDTIGILGLSFKPESDDVRDTPAAKVISELIERGFDKIIAYDPLAIEEFRKYYDYDISYDTIENVLEKSDELVILTAWDEFKTVADKTDKEIIDCRYIL
jgi:UDPglucose 6-dehydrogenase